MDENEIKIFLEAALLAAGRPLSVDQLLALFDTDAAPTRQELRKAIESLTEDYEDRGFTIAQVASGYRIQIKSAMAERLHRLWEERPPRYSRALFETLALIAYRQPITRGEIEEIRGVSVSTNIIRSLLEREWVRVVGHRDVPGRPAMFGTTKAFLDYFGLRKLDDLPPLADLADWENLRVQLNLPEVETEPGESADAAAPELAEVTELSVAAGASDDPETEDAAAEAESTDTEHAEVADLPVADDASGEAETEEAAAEVESTDAEVESVPVADDASGEAEEQEATTETQAVDAELAEVTDLPLPANASGDAEAQEVSAEDEAGTDSDANDEDVDATRLQG